METLVPEVKFDEAFVATTLGNIRQADLQTTVKQVDENKDCWVYARECVYIGTEHPQAVGTIVRRDVWVTFKVGQAAKAASEL